MWRRAKQFRCGLPNSHSGRSTGGNRHIRRGLVRARVRLVGVATVLGSLLAGGVGSAQSASAVVASAKPVITNYDANPATLPYTGGSVTLSATVSGASSCTFSTAGRGISGLPTTVACTSGSASAIVVVAANTATRSKALNVKLTAIGTDTESSGVT